jgi:PPM family protein phosphatase
MQYAAVSALSHDGLVREHNEDSLAVGAWTVCAATTLSPQTIYLPIGDPIVVAVADGLGGHPAGEEASSLVVRSLARAAQGMTGEAAVRDALDACNDDVYAEAARHPERTGMGTTVAGLVITEQAVLAFNVGDSRVYRVEDTGLVQLSTDDNEPPAPGERRSSIVTQALGGNVGAAAIEPHVSTTPLPRSARYLICSDGLTDAVDDAAIAAILRSHDGGEAAFALWRATIQAGAPDNVTVALVEVATEPDA